MHTNAILGILQQIHDGKTHIGEYLSLIFQDMPIGIAWKDARSVSQGTNPFLAKVIGLSHPQDIIGKTDFDLLPDKDASAFVADDLDVLATGKPRFNDIRFANFSKKCTIVQNVSKFPIFDDEKNPVGIVGIGHILSMTNQKMAQRIDRLLNVYKNNNLFAFYDSEQYYVEIDDRAVCLTTRQAECLTYLSTGKTVKEIASLIDCSHFTVEEHIKHLKRKLGVCSTSELINCFWHNHIRWF